MTITTEEQYNARKVGEVLVRELRQIASEKHFLPCKEASNGLIENDQVLLVKSLGLGKDGRYLFKEDNGILIQFPQRWIVKNVKRNGVLVLENPETGEYKITKPDDSIVKAAEIFNTDADIKDSIDDELRSRGKAARVNMKAAFLSVSANITSFIESKNRNSNSSSVRYFQVLSPKDYVQDLLTTYSLMLSKGEPTIEDGDRLRDSLINSQKDRVNRLLLEGSSKYDYRGMLPSPDKLFEQVKGGNTFIDNEGILIPGSSDQFIDLVVNWKESVTVHLNKLKFDRSGVSPRLVVETGLSIDLTPREVLRIFFGEEVELVDAEDIKDPEGKAWFNLKRKMRVSPLMRERAISEYNRKLQDEFERGLLEPLLDGFIRAHPRRRTKKSSVK